MDSSATRTPAGHAATPLLLAALSVYAAARAAGAELAEHDLRLCSGDREPAQADANPVRDVGLGCPRATR